jgi:hypothetical protein
MTKAATKLLKDKKMQAARELSELNDKVNAFHWRTFVQPVPMKADKWSQQPRPDQEVNTRFTQYS